MFVSVNIQLLRLSLLLSMELPAHPFYLGALLLRFHLHYGEMKLLTKKRGFGCGLVLVVCLFS